MDKQKVLICGAGSIGIFLGVKLHAKGHEVELFGRRKLKGVKDSIYINNRLFNLPKKLYNMPKYGNYDYIFITSKLYDLENIVRLIHQKKIKGKIIAGVQNGLIDASKYKKVLNNKRLIPICVFGGFRIQENRLITNPTPLGWKTEDTKEGKNVSKLISSCGISCKPEKKIDSIRVEKMITNCCLNALSAIEKKPFNLLFKQNKTRKRILTLFDECCNVLNKEHNLEDPKTIKKKMFRNWHKVNHYSSTYQDVMSGRKTEINYFNGYIIELGKKYNINIEENKKIITNFREAIKHEKL